METEAYTSFRNLYSITKIHLTCKAMLLTSIPKDSKRK